MSEIQKESAKQVEGMAQDAATEVKAAVDSSAEAVEGAASDVVENTNEAAEALVESTSPSEEAVAIAAHEQQTTAITLQNEDAMGIIKGVGESSVYLMGFSFILGSLLTILVLILLDFMRRNSPNK